MRQEKEQKDETEERENAVNPPAHVPPIPDAPTMLCRIYIGDLFGPRWPGYLPNVRDYPKLSADIPSRPK